MTAIHYSDDWVMAVEQRLERLEALAFGSLDHIRLDTFSPSGETCWTCLDCDTTGKDKVENKARVAAIQHRREKHQ